jgi:hypothetical protein
MAQYYRMNPVDLDEDRIAEATGAGLSALSKAAEKDTF